MPQDPPPTAFVPGAKYHLLMQAFGGVGVEVSTADELQVRRLCLGCGSNFVCLQANRCMCSWCAWLARWPA